MGTALTGPEKSTFLATQQMFVEAFYFTCLYFEVHVYINGNANPRR